MHGKEVLKRKIGYMKVKEIHGLLKIKLIPLTREEAKRILKGEKTCR